MIASSQSPVLAHQIAKASLADASPLDQCWRTLFGTEPPRSRSLIEQAIAWREQVQLGGDVSAAVRRDLVAAAVAARAAPDPKLIGGGAQPSAGAGRGPLARPVPGQLTPGTRLVKAHGGRTHVVEVTADGMLYEGQLYASLSAVAKAITGTHWNGLLFFGLRKRKVYPAQAAARG